MKLHTLVSFTISTSHKEEGFTRERDDRVTLETREQNYTEKIQKHLTGELGSRLSDGEDVGYVFVKNVSVGARES